MLLQAYIQQLTQIFKWICDYKKKTQKKIWRVPIPYEEKQ